MSYSDTITIGTQTYTTAYAVSIGLVRIVDGEAVLTAKAQERLDSAAAKAKRIERGDADWRARQGIPEPEEPETTSDGRLKPTKAIKPKRPRNVTKTGEEVTDPEVLAKIAAEADEKAKAFAESVRPDPEVVEDDDA